jgi:hypothetical protein
VSPQNFEPGARVRVVDAIAGTYAPGSLDEYVVTVVDGVWEWVDMGDYHYCKCIDPDGTVNWYGQSMILGLAA